MPLEDKNNLSKTVLVAKRSIVNNIVFPKLNAALDEVQRQNLGKEKNINLNFKDKKHKYVDVSIIHSTTQTPNIHLQVYQTLEPLEFLLTLHTLRS